MVQHDNKVRRYNEQSVEVGDATGENNTEALYEKRNPYLLDYEKEYRNQTQSRQEYSQRAAGVHRQATENRENVECRYGENADYYMASGYEENADYPLAGEYGESADYPLVGEYGENADYPLAGEYGESADYYMASGYEENADYLIEEYMEGTTCRNESEYRESVDSCMAGGYREPTIHRNTGGYRDNTVRRSTGGYRDNTAHRNAGRYAQGTMRRSTGGSTLKSKGEYRKNVDCRMAVGRGEGTVRKSTGGYAQRANCGGTARYAQTSSRHSRISPTEVSVRRSTSGHAPSHTAARRLAQYRRRKRIFMQRMAVSIWVLCLLCLAVTLLVKNNRAAAAGQDRKENQNAVISSTNDVTPKPLEATQPDPVLVQGIPATVFAKHPEWTENFLTPNEYSRPGDPLESVTNIFVHYTANPGTSAAQNRSYFERQKDEHLTSVSAHFIIGYEGEIIQCVPLDEVAYAVKSRNFDSVSIECCHLAKDGAFTQETYDSLISLLKWLLEVYDLSSEDILRHYDCGGKKCPLYYTEHPDAWEELKKDVDKL